MTGKSHRPHQPAQLDMITSFWASQKTRSTQMTRGIVCLFTGPSGTGKTQAAEFLASRLNLPMYRMDLSATVSKYIGETEKNLRHLFAAAEAADVILFFDEADALFGKRTGIRDAHDRFGNISVSYLLESIKRSNGIVILAADSKESFDPAFARRARFVIKFPHTVSSKANDE